MRDDLIKEFEDSYSEIMFNQNSIPTKEQVFMQMLRNFINSKTKRDRKRSAKLILKTKPSMGKSELWRFIDEDKLRETINS